MNNRRDQLIGGFISTGIFLIIIASLFLLMSCNATLEGYKQYDPNNGVIEYRYNPSWGYYRHFYYRPVPYNDRWIYRDYYWNDTYYNRRIVVPKRRVKSITRRGGNGKTQIKKGRTSQGKGQGRNARTKKGS